MTNPIPKKISELPTLGGISDGDLIPVVDISDTSFNTSGETKKVSYSVFKATIQQEIDTEFSAQSIDVLNDVDTSTAAADDILKWNGNSWVAAAESQGTTIKGEIALGSAPVWKGSSGLTVIQESSGMYRLTFATAYGNNSDYFVIAQGMDHSASASSYIRVARSTTYVDIIVKNQANDNAVNTGAVGIQIINHN